MEKIKFAVGLILLLGLLGSITPIPPADAAPDEVKWSRVNIPTEGKPGNWVLAPGSDVQHLTMAVDGTLYAYGKGLTYTLYKSIDGGYSWSYIGGVEDNIVDIATEPDVASIVYYATLSDVYKSTDAGISFTPLPPNPGGAGNNEIEITSIDVVRLGSHNIIAVGTKDKDGSEYGGLYILDESQPFTWVDSNIGSYDVYAVAFSPNFAFDQQLVAVVTDETDTFVTTKFGDAGWGETVGDARLDKDNSGMSIALANSAVIAFPSDYEAATGHDVLFVAIDTESDEGDVYRISSVPAPGSSVATDLNIGSAYGLNNVDVTSLAITGNATAANMLAGVADSAQLYLSYDAGINWTRSTKEPTGEGKTYVLVAPDFISSGKACAATSGAGSAFSYTTDGGITWNQLSLIDTKISQIVDLALSPSYGQDNNLFMLAWGGEHSLWRSLNGGTIWERVYSSTLPNVDLIDKVGLSPQYGHGSQVVFMAGSSNGNPAIWKSTDNGQSFSLPQVPHDPTTGATLTIDVWTVVNDNTLFIGSYNGSNGLVYHTTNSGLSYSTGAVVGDQSLYSIVLSPNYEQEETILVGNTNGWVYWSEDNGISFEPLPPDATSPPLTDFIAVTFDPQYSSNNTVYAASGAAGKGIYRFTIGTSPSWESINSPADGMIGQLMVSADGTLYATNFKADGGMERCLNPTFHLAPTFETVTRGLDAGAKLIGLWLHGNQLWSIDTTNTRLMTYTDSLAVPVILTSPPNKAPAIGTIINYEITNVTLDWEVLTGATQYHWQLDYDRDFSSVPTGFEGDTGASSARLPPLELATKYYWRVRAIGPVLSRWSPKWSFTTSIGAPTLYSPQAGASGVGLKPLFQWSSIAWATSYELLVSTNASFSNPVISMTGGKALPTTAWLCDTELDYDTTYYWKVRAIGSDTYSPWSDIGIFTTISESTTPPLEPPLLQAPSPGAVNVCLTPSFVWSGADWATGYEFILAEDNSFTHPVISKLGNDALPTAAWLCDTELDYNTTYYWKVRALSSDSYSPWSDTGIFTTIPEPTITPPSLQAPSPGAVNVCLTPSFAWSGADWATGYEFILARDNKFTDEVITKTGNEALPTTAWLCDTELDYDTTYYWKVRALSSDSYSPWSDTGIFTTIPEPTTPPPEPPLLQAPSPAALVMFA